MEKGRYSMKDISAVWHIHYKMDMHCVARSDGGVDYRGEYMNKEMSIPPELVVLEDGEPIGISFCGHLFRFDDPGTHTLVVEEDERYVGGWGDVTETKFYTLTAGPAPEGSFPATVQ